MIVIDLLIVFAHAVVDNLEKSAGKIGFIAMRQMTTVAEVHGKHLVAWLEKGEIHRHVRAASRMGLNIHMFGPKEPSRPVNGQLLDSTHMFTTAVPAPPWITFSVLVGED